MKPDIGVEIAGIKMVSPVIMASGTFGFGVEYADLVDLNRLGGIAVKGITLLPRSGNSGRRIAETPAGMLNCIGLENPGIDAFLANILPQLNKYCVPVIVNIAGNTKGEYGELAKMLEGAQVSALEINISCPNVKKGGIQFGTDAQMAAEIISTVKNNTTKPVIAKLSPNVTDIISIAKAVEAAGADAISLINTLLGMAIDSKTQRPILGNIFGGLSGPAIKPIALRMVYQVAQDVHVPVIGMGGVMNSTDALEFLIAGASAVMVGTANFVNPQVGVDIAEGIRGYLSKQQIKGVNALVGSLKLD
jgi:dihydroorotate dehydrogenase (NAD+) catalytic subunit